MAHLVDSGGDFPETSETPQKAIESRDKLGTCARFASSGHTKGTAMSLHAVNIEWSRQTADFQYDTYSRDHQWAFPNGVTVEATAAAEFLGSEQRVDPEASFVASIASCHMLTFLAIAARRRLVVDRYTDAAVGTLAKNEQGQLVITHVRLRPSVVFSGDKEPSHAELGRLHELAHQGCFIANSVKTLIAIDWDK